MGWVCEAARHAVVGANGIFACMARRCTSTYMYKVTWTLSFCYTHTHAKIHSPTALRVDTSRHVVHAITRVVDCAVIRAIVTFAHGLSQSTASWGLPVSSPVTVSAQFPCLDENIMVGKSPCSNTTGPLIESGSKRTGARTGGVMHAIRRRRRRRSDRTHSMPVRGQTLKSVFSHFGAHRLLRTNRRRHN